jgi:hypothetical protein
MEHTGQGLRGLLVQELKILRLPRSPSRRRLLYAISVLLVAFIALFLYERPAHHYNTAYEACWMSAVHSLLASNPSPLPTGVCAAPPGALAGVGRLVATTPMTQSKDHALVIFATSEGTFYAGLAYVLGDAPPPDTCVTPLGGPWWQFRSGTAEGNCPRGYTFQPAP